jgi:hypothetical protein
MPSSDGTSATSIVYYFDGDSPARNDAVLPAPLRVALGGVAHAPRAGLWKRAEAGCRSEADTQ